MSDLTSSLCRTVLLPDHPAAIPMLALPALADLVGPGAVAVSLAYEYGAAISPGEPVEVQAEIIRGTRTLLFAQARIMTGSGAIAADISAVYRRQIGQENPSDRKP